jgi:hypothetical protein
LRGGGYYGPHSVPSHAHASAMMPVQCSPLHLPLWHWGRPHLTSAQRTEGKQAASTAPLHLPRHSFRRDGRCTLRSPRVPPLGIPPAIRSLRPCLDKEGLKCILEIERKISSHYTSIHLIPLQSTSIQDYPNRPYRDQSGSQSGSDSAAAALFGFGYTNPEEDSIPF